MAELLRGLGFTRASWWSVAWLLAVIGATASAFLVLAHLAAAVLGAPIVVVHAVLWATWLVWLGGVFPHSRRAWMRGFGAGAFRPAFYLEILPGIGCSFAQIARPAFEAVIGGPRITVLGAIVGSVVVLTGFGLVVLGVRRLGIAGTLFVREYETLPPLLERGGVFREIRHPLFVGGVVLSLGGAIATGTAGAIVLALVNVLTIPFYVHFEDARCGQIFGAEYAVYRAGVGGALPRASGQRLRSRARG
jgi:protein-S-isoprenylcysteine O-methyltransferase Ste14